MDVSSALEQVAAFDGRSDIRAVIRVLMSADCEVAEPALLDIMAADNGTRADPFQVASRILAERDPDRDPQYLLRYMPDDRPIAGNSPIRRWARKVNVYPPVSACIYGLSRLRRFDPVGTYGRLLDEPFSITRMEAASALGDTADPAALDPLAKALADPKKWVRGRALNAVHRLSHTTSAAIVLGHPIRQGLMTALADRNKKLALAVAYVLADLGDVEAVREYVTRNPRRRRLFAPALAGQIPPLRPFWPGDETV